jgi:hypothetical protein
MKTRAGKLTGTLVSIDSELLKMSADGELVEFLVN